MKLIMPQIAPTRSFIIHKQGNSTELKIDRPIWSLGTLFPWYG